jgi:hypothetical protein
MCDRIAAVRIPELAHRSILRDALVVWGIRDACRLVWRR